MTNFFIDLHGCAKNQVDAEIISSRLQNLGLILVKSAEDADLIIVNSCGFIESAKTESLQSLLNYRQDYPNKKIILAGCLAERYADVLKDEIPEIDGIFGNGDLSKIDELVLKLKNNISNSVVVSKFPQLGVCSDQRKELFNFPSSVYIKITEGCNNCCSFCAIPLIRGSLRSREINQIICEIKHFINRGIYEFNLIGQDLAAFGTDFQNNSKHSPLYNLLEQILLINEDFRIRLLYIHPDHFPFDILDLIQQDKRILPYFDIPFQSGDDSIIKAMNRVGSKESYVELVKKIRNSCKNTEYGTAVLRTTFLCGFPGENEDAFNNTKKFLEEIQSDWSGCFTYSAEEDTPAALMPKKVSNKVAQKRANKLYEIQSSITENRLGQFVGQNLNILIEEILPFVENSDNSEKVGIAIGRAWFQAPDVDGATVVYYDLEDTQHIQNMLPGKIVNCKITGVSGVDVTGIYV